MATYKHPVTGVPLNKIDVKRKSLLRADAITIHLLKREGVTYTDIVQMMGTNPHRVGEVLRGEIFAQTTEEACRASGGDLFIKA